MTGNPAIPRFEDVERSFSSILRFPGGRLASFTVSFGVAEISHYRMAGSEGVPAWSPLTTMAWSDGCSSTTAGHTETRAFPPSDQFAPELVRFAEAVATGRPAEPGGREGLADVRVIESLFASVGPA